MARLPFAAAAALVFVSFTACGGGDAVSPGPGPGPGPNQPAPIVSIELTPATADVAVGRTAQLAATARDAAGNALAGRTFTWTSSATATATVDANGVVTGVAPGAVTVTVAGEGKNAIAAITVRQTPVAAITVTPNASTLDPGQTATLTATTRDDAGVVLTGRTIRWTSGAPTIASVDGASGLVTAVASGTATITATSEGKSATAVVTVNSARVPVSTVAVGGALDTLEAYDVRPMQATLRDAQGGLLAGRTVRWTSSDAAVATIDSVTGILTGIDRGTVTITASSEGKSGVATRVVVIKYRSITAGTMHACDIASGGIAWCWGLNGSEGRLGSTPLSPTAMSSTPVRVTGGHQFVQLASFGRHTCGLIKEGRAFCWGFNGWGALGAGSKVSESPTPLPVAGGLTFRSITAGSDHACGVTFDNRALCWGNNDWRQLGYGGSAPTSSPTIVMGGIDFATVAAGASFTCGVAQSGTAYCWGANSIGQVGDGLPISYGNTFVSAPTAVTGGLRFRTVSLGNQYACGLTVGAAAYCWGSNNSKLGDGGAADASSPRAVAGGLSFTSLSTGYAHACGVTSQQEIYCWGSNGSGQLGNSSAGTPRPMRAGGSLLAAEVAASGIGTGSGSHTCAISADRLTAACWGRNDVGQLGNGGTTPGASANSAPSIVVTQKPLPIR
jgi:uncharacterized protein YjdB/alpha-tubulin suppressor-like RCC1 family protein